MRNCLLFIFFSLSFCSVDAQSTYFPGNDWEEKPPAELKMNPLKLDSAVSFALASENNVDRDLRVAILKSFGREPDYKIAGPTKERGGPAGLILKNGYIVAQWGDIHRVDMTFSVTKSFLSTTTGLAIDNGLINSVNDKVKDYVWDGTFQSEHNSKITWDHLLTQSSDWSGTLFGLHDWADRPPMEGTLEDWKHRKLNEPGTVFKYNDVRVNLLAYSLLQVWRKPLPVVLKEKIMDPIGASSTWRWYGYDNTFINMDGMMMQSVSGGGHHGGGIFISAIDQARFGLLFLRKGKWKNQQLLSENWIEQAHVPSLANKDYGYMWWINTTKKWKDVSPEVYFGAGYGGNFIVVDHANDLVVVTRWMDNSKMSDFMSLVYQSLK
jgi:CubicO group peptidase (beta-lactamase class C family)